MSETETMGFEALLQELETVVARLESEELSLDEAISLFERGQMLLNRCQDQLATAELKVQQLTEEGI